MGFKDSKLKRQKFKNPKKNGKAKNSNKSLFVPLSFLYVPTEALFAVFALQH